MSNNSLDYSKLSNSLQKTYKLTDVQHRLEKVAFDIVRFKDGDPEELWQIQNADDGAYIVARYELDAPVTAEATTKTASKSDWDVSLNTKTSQIDIFYKNYQVAKFSAKTLGVSDNDLLDACRYLPNKLAIDKSMVKSLLDNLSATERYQICRQFPELNK